MLPDKSVGFTPAHGGMKAHDAIESMRPNRVEATPSGSIPGRGSQSNPYRGADVEVSTPRTGVDVAQSSGEDNYIDNATGERIGLTEKLKRSGPGAPTSREYSGNQGSLAHMSKGGNRFSNVKDQTIVSDQGVSTPIGNTSMGSTMQNVVAAGQNAVAKSGNYDQMNAVGNAAYASKMPVSPALQGGMAEANNPINNPLKKKGNLAPRKGTK